MDNVDIPTGPSCPGSGHWDKHHSKTVQGRMKSAPVDRVDTGTVRDWAGSVPKDRAYMLGRSD